MKEDREITIYDIARRLNVSAATVSRSLKDHHAISNATKKKVHAVAREMGYRSNSFARNLRRQQANTLGLIVPRLNSYVVSSIIAGMEKIANEFGYNIIISQSLGSAKKEISNIDMMFDSRVDGLLVSLAHDAKSMDHFNAFFNKHIPVVFFDRVCEDARSLNIVIDNYKSAYNITRHLIEQGCRRIMHIAGQSSTNIYAERCRGYKDALLHAGLYFDDNLLVVNDLTEKSGIEAGNQILQMTEKPDGVFVANDLCAIYCMQTLRAAGMKIPQEIAFAGFNNEPITKIVEPNLTTVNYPCYEMGEMAARCLIDHLSGARTVDNANTIILRSEIIVRQSSLKMKNETALLMVDGPESLS
ncbi:LacI family DNA-binding transcriptional regulator [Pinibacter soli]|uniref:LacI family DNA-binding transcriptional regulator n=1 Tax=Pinibacter soli TaxID=3044211 RepID=A0ABT6RE61_9BACT|nr:LacI family DNA-binding transcriptional regulator [Pinibacter soli]MDI3320872.1 LacI family DNA-binding transcriptional regulator [Pinibacter soli]